jgi:hypothetical protein
LNRGDKSTGAGKRAACAGNSGEGGGTGGSGESAESTGERELDPATLAIVEQRLGRTPRGLRAVAVVDAQGLPQVIRVASLVDDKPFPTLFWLIDPVLALKIDREEAAGTIAMLQARLDHEPALREAMAEDHRRHIALRDGYVSAAERDLLESRGQWSALAGRGIGGIADSSRIRCLHTWYAAHLVVPNTIGRLLDERWAKALGSDSGPD